MAPLEERVEPKPPLDAGDRRQSDTTPRNLAYLTTVLVAMCVIGLFTVEVPEKNETLVTTVVSQIVIGWSAALAYYYNSTHNARVKDQMLLNAQAPK